MNTPVHNIEYFKYHVRDAWAEFINRYHWEWFVTLTFTVDVHPETAFKSMRHWINMLNLQLYGRRWRKKPPFGVYWVACEEYQQRGTLHYHLLMSGVKNARRLSYMDIWVGLGNKNGFARVEPVESQTKASHYLCKYLVKDGEIFLSDNLSDVTSGFERLWSDSNPTTESSPAEPSAQVE